MKRLLIIAFAILFSSGIFAQVLPTKHVVFLKNKDNNPYSLSNPSAFLTQRALDRRTRYGIALDSKDLPVTPDYVTQIRSTGAEVYYSLKWFNAVVVATDNPVVLGDIQALPFVDHIDQVLNKNPVHTSGEPGIKQLAGIPPFTLNNMVPAARTKGTSVFNYGQAYNQAHMISVDLLHNQGYTGEGMIIAILDAGFPNVDVLPAFDSLRLNNRLLGTRDFNQPGNNVMADSMHYHGTMVLSTIGANLPGLIVGTAPHASFWLVRTEVGWSDYEAPVEEYNWAGGAEFADSLGVDVINSSLGYTNFINPVYNHTYADMDGNTTPITRAADLACSRGMMVVSAAGNEGGSAWHYISAPADGDSVFSLGAVDQDGNYASFSSTGPTADGRVKPDVVTQGENTTIVTPGGNVTQGSGTSFASPIMAGAMACLWQSSQISSAQKLRDAVRFTASQATNPDDLLGYGIPNMMNALAILTGISDPYAGQNTFSLFPVPFSTAPWLQNNQQKPEPVKVDILTVTGQLLQSQEISVNGSSTRLDAFSTLPSGLYFIRIKSNSGQQVIRAVKL